MNITNLFSNNGIGSGIYFSLMITSAVPFQLSQIIYSFSNPHYSISNSFAQFGISFTGMGQGVGTNGTIYRSGNANSWLNAVYIVGGGQTLITDGRSIDEMLAIYPTYSNSVSYSLFGQTVGIEEEIFNPTSTLKPIITNILISGTNITIKGTNGRPNFSYIVLAATNLTTPATNWLPIATNSFDNSGNFNLTNAIGPIRDRHFYRLKE